MATKTVLTGNRPALLEPLLRGTWVPQILLPVLHDDYGIVCVDDLESPTVGSLALSDFLMFVGDASSPNAAYFVATAPSHYYLLRSDDRWLDLVLHESRDKGSWERRSIFSERTLQLSRLDELAEVRPPAFEVRRFDRGAVLAAASSRWSRSLVENFESVEQFLQRGIGFGVFQGDHLVAGAASFTVSRGTCEIEVDTDPSFRRRGLAMLASAHLVRHCLKSGLTPHWDAANPPSCALAEKLGFTLERTYDVLRV